MDNLFVVDVLHRVANLDKPIQDLILWERFPLLSYNSTIKITAISVLHDDAEFTIFCFENFDKFDDVWMI